MTCQVPESTHTKRSRWKVGTGVGELSDGDGFDSPGAGTPGTGHGSGQATRHGSSTVGKMTSHHCPLIGQTSAGTRARPLIAAGNQLRKRRFGR